MARLCERPGCSLPADVGYGIDPDRLTVWIEPLVIGAERDPGVLCRRHADAMVVPLRWTLDDRREAVPRLFRPPAGLAASNEARVPKRRRRAVGFTQLDLVDDTGPVDRVVEDAALTIEAPADSPVDSPAAAAEDATTVAAARASIENAEPGDGSGGGPVTWRPVFDQSDDLDGLLQADGPLLSRAFGKRDRPPRK